MADPLDPATLAHLYALPPYRLTKAEVRILVAVARDHARLTAALDRISWDIDDDNHVEIARAALSAEAGDQGTWMGGGLEITYPSAEAGDTDA
jgi:hypothetical protein